MARQLDRRALLQELERVRYSARENAVQGQLEQMQLGGALLALARIDHEREYAICRQVVEHLLGQVHEPEDVSIDP